MKERVVTSAYVKVELDTRMWGGKFPPYRSVAAKANDLMKEIQRHVDIPADIDWECETEDICGFCGRDWDCGLAGPQCCDKAKAEWIQQEEEKKKTADQKMREATRIEKGKVVINAGKP